MFGFVIFIRSTENRLVYGTKIIAHTLKLSMFTYSAMNNREFIFFASFFVYRPIQTRTEITILNVYLMNTRPYCLTKSVFFFFKRNTIYWLRVLSFFVFIMSIQIQCCWLETNTEPKSSFFFFQVTRDYPGRFFSSTTF